MFNHVGFGSDDLMRKESILFKKDFSSLKTFLLYCHLFCPPPTLLSCEGSFGKGCDYSVTSIICIWFMSLFLIMIFYFKVRGGARIYSLTFVYMITPFYYPSKWFRKNFTVSFLFIIGLSIRIWEKRLNFYTSTFNIYN